jgi:hypothetical protein
MVTDMQVSIKFLVRMVIGEWSGVLDVLHTPNAMLKRREFKYLSHE